MSRTSLGASRPAKAQRKPERRRSPQAATGPVWWSTLAGLALLIVGGPLNLLAYLLPYEDYSHYADWDPPGPALGAAATAMSAELLVALLAVLALLQLLARTGTGRSLVFALRGAASWTLAIGVFQVVLALSHAPGLPGPGYGAMLAAAGLMIAGGVLVLAPGWHRPGSVRTFPVVAAITLPLAVAEGVIILAGISELDGLLPWSYPVALGAAGVLLLRTRDDDPDQIWLWSGWGVIGLLHIWGFGTPWTGDATSATQLWLSCIVPLAVIAIAWFTAARNLWDQVASR